MHSMTWKQITLLWEILTPYWSHSFRCIRLDPWERVVSAIEYALYALRILIFVNLVGMQRYCRSSRGRKGERVKRVVPHQTPLRRVVINIAGVGKLRKKNKQKSDKDRLDSVHPTVKPIKRDLFESYARFMIYVCRDVPFKSNTVCEESMGVRKPSILHWLPFRLWQSHSWHWIHLVKHS